MDAMKSQKDWLDYINRLQDRERQKINSTGLTNWALLLALAGLAYWIYPDIPKIHAHWKTTFIGYIFFHNLTISIFDIMHRQKNRQDKIKKFRNSTNQIDKTGLLLLSKHETIMLYIGLLGNSYLLYHSFNEGFILFFIYFIVYFTRYFLQLYGDLMIKLLKKMKMAVISAFLNEVFNLLSSITLSLIATVAVLISVGYHYDFNNILWKQFFDGLSLVIIFILSQFLIIIFIKRMKISWLEEFEKEIIAKDLDRVEIVQKLKKEYFSLSNIDDFF